MSLSQHPSERPRPVPAETPSCLALTVDTPKMKLLDAVPEEWVERSIIEAALGYAGKPLSERVHELIALGLLEERKVVEDNRRREYRRTAAGTGLLNDLRPHVLTAKAHLCAAGAGREKLFDESLAERWDRMLVRAVLENPQHFRELQSLTHTLAQSWPLLGTGLSDGSLERRLDRLTRLGLIAANPSSRRENAPEYVPGPDLWLMARLGPAASLWSTLHTPERGLPLSGDLLGLVAMVRERIRLDPELPQAPVVFHVRAPAGMHVWADVAICPERGRARLVQDIPTRPAAYVQASIPVWAQALLGGEFALLAVEHDTRMARAAFDGVVAALPPE